MALVLQTSPYSVRTTIDRVTDSLAARGIEVFARIDHGAGARAAGLELPDEEVVIFGDPRSGTPLMQDDAAIGYELPLRLLAWDAGGETRVGYRPPPDLADDYAVADRSEGLERMRGLLEAIVAESVASE